MHSLPSILMQAPPSFISPLKGERQEREEREEREARGQQEKKQQGFAWEGCCVWAAAVLCVWPPPLSVYRALGRCLSICIHTVCIHV